MLFFGFGGSENDRVSIQVFDRLGGIVFVDHDHSILGGRSVAVGQATDWRDIDLGVFCIEHHDRLFSNHNVGATIRLFHRCFQRAAKTKFDFAPQ